LRIIGEELYYLEKGKTREKYFVCARKSILPTFLKGGRKK